MIVPDEHINTLSATLVFILYPLFLKLENVRKYSQEIGLDFLFFHLLINICRLIMI